MCGTPPKIHAYKDDGTPLCGQASKRRQHGIINASVEDAKRSVEFFYTYVPLSAGEKARANKSWRCKNCEKLLQKV